MTRTISSASWAWVLTFCTVAGCDGPESSLLLPSSTPEPVGAIVGFDHPYLVEGMTYPVVAMDAEERLHRAAISDMENWPVFLSPQNEPTRFPGRGTSARGLAMTADAEYLHATWVAMIDREFFVMYARFDPETLEGTSVTLPVVTSAFGPTLAVSEEGEVVITYTDGTGARTPEAELRMYRGQLETGFSDTERVMPDCCADTYTNMGYAVNAGAIRFDDAGRIHFVYTWHNGPETYVDYVVETEDSWRLDARFSDADYGHQPGLELDEDLAHVSYYAPTRTALVHAVVQNQTVIENEPVYIDDRVRSALMAMRADGTLHFVIEGRTDDSEFIDHVSLPAAPEGPVRIAESTGFLGVQLNPRTGGLLAEAQTLIVPYLERNIERRGPTYNVRLAIGTTRD